MWWRSAAAMFILGAALLSCDRSGPPAGVTATGSAGAGIVATGGTGGRTTAGTSGAMVAGTGGAMLSGAGGSAGSGVSTVTPAAFEYNGSVSIVREK